MKEASGIGVQHGHLIFFAPEDLVNDNPPAWLEAAIGGVVLGVVGDDALAGADDMQVHVAVEVVRVNQGVSDAMKEVWRTHEPLRPFFICHGRTHR